MSVCVCVFEESCSACCHVRALWVLFLPHCNKLLKPLVKKDSETDKLRYSTAWGNT